MKYKKIYILVLLICIFCFLLFNFKIDFDELYNDSETSYETSDNNYLNNNFSTHYFNKLSNHGVNSHGSCSYIAMIMLLSFYNIYHDDNILLEKYEYNKTYVTNILSIDVSPGISVEPGSLHSYDNLTQYIKNIRNNYNEYFHFNLIKTGLDTLNFYDNYFDNDIYFSESVEEIELNSLGITSNEHLTLLEYYLYEKCLYSNSNVKIVSCFQDHNKNYNFIVENILNGNPVVFFARTEDNKRGHAMVAYDYDSINDEIICHLGWGKYSAKAKYSSTKYTHITGAYTIHFHNEHNCSNNYIRANNSTICPCSLNMPINYVNNYVKLDNSIHQKTCECGFTISENHNYSYEYKNNTYHNKICSCSQPEEVPHIVLKETQNYGTCIICGARINLSIDGFIGILNINQMLNNNNLYYQLQNGIIVLSTKGAELYNRGLLTFDNNGQNIYNI